jgi:hypothetical protein
LTLYLAKFLGLSCLLMCAALFSRPKASLSTIEAMVESPALILVTGIVTLAAGAALVIGHNVWSRGALPLAVTLLGWLTLIKGVALVAIPPSALSAFYRGIRDPQRFRLIMAIGAGLSAWLAIAAFES